MTFDREDCDDTQMENNLNVISNREEETKGIIFETFDRDHWNSFEFTNFRFVFLLVAIKTSFESENPKESWISMTFDRGRTGPDDVENNLNTRTTP